MAIYECIGNMPKAKAQKKSKRGIFSRWKRQIVVNSMQARLRAQLGDRSEYSGERRRRSVVVASIVLTITDPLRGSYPLLCNLQAALIRSCGASFACMELTIISRFQRLQASTKSFTSFTICYIISVLSPLWCNIFDLIVNGNLLTHWKHAEGMSLRYGVYVMVLLSLLNLLNCVRMVHIVI